MDRNSMTNPRNSSCMSPWDCRERNSRSAELIPYCTRSRLPHKVVSEIFLPIRSLRSSRFSLFTSSNFASNRWVSFLTSPWSKRQTLSRFQHFAGITRCWAQVLQQADELVFQLIGKDLHSAAGGAVTPVPPIPPRFPSIESTSQWITAQ
jgi:hypothetical protein